jgi:hypothetical protein
VTFTGNLCSIRDEPALLCTCPEEGRPPTDMYGNCKNCCQPGWLCTCGMRAEATDEEETETP